MPIKVLTCHISFFQTELQIYFISTEPKVRTVSGNGRGFIECLLDR